MNNTNNKNINVWRQTILSHFFEYFLFFAFSICFYWHLSLFITLYIYILLAHMILVYIFVHSLYACCECMSVYWRTCVVVAIQESELPISITNHHRYMTWLHVLCVGDCDLWLVEANFCLYVRKNDIHYIYIYYTMYFQFSLQFTAIHVLYMEWCIYNII